MSAGQNVTLSAVGSAAACGHTIASYSWSIVGSSTTAIQNANTAFGNHRSALFGVRYGSGDRHR